MAGKRKESPLAAAAAPRAAGKTPTKAKKAPKSKAAADLVPELSAAEAAYMGQGRTLVPDAAQLELFCPPYNPTQLMNVYWSCSS
jgi:hypothetical protein